MAVSGARVAAYLRGEAEAKPAGEKILERLTLPQPAAPAPAPAPQVAEKVDEEKLAALAKAPGPARLHIPGRKSPCDG